VGGMKGRKELSLGDVGYRASGQTLYFSTICLFQRPKAPYIKTLKWMRGMRRHTERNDLILAIFLEFDGVVTFVTIKDQEAIATVRSLRCRSIKT
jgi:hypothetical protein